jgi:hypothetical protein
MTSSFHHPSQHHHSIAMSSSLYHSHHHTTTPSCHHITSSQHHLTPHHHNDHRSPSLHSHHHITSHRHIITSSYRITSTHGHIITHHIITSSNYYVIIAPLSHHHTITPTSIKWWLCMWWLVDNWNGWCDGRCDGPNLTASHSLSLVGTKDYPNHSGKFHIILQKWQMARNCLRKYFERYLNLRKQFIMYGSRVFAVVTPDYRWQLRVVRISSLVWRAQICVEFLKSGEILC